jgi:hypothetical protein
MAMDKEIHTVIFILVSIRVLFAYTLYTAFSDSHVLWQKDRPTSPQDQEFFGPINAFVHIMGDRVVGNSFSGIAQRNWTAFEAECLFSAEQSHSRTGQPVLPPSSLLVCASF